MSELVLQLQNEQNVDINLVNDTTPLDLQIGNQESEDPGLVLDIGEGMEGFDLQMENEDDMQLSLDTPGTKDYNELDNKPKINGITLIGNKTLAELLGSGLIIDGGTAAEVAS